MNKMVKSLLAASLMGSFLSFTPMAPAQAETQFALVCMGTLTGSTIYFKYRWGNNDWKDVSVSPGQWHWITHEYDYPGQNQSPRLQVMFDDDNSSGVNPVIVTLSPNAAEHRDCENEGHTYKFWLRGDEIMLRDTH